MEEAERFAEEEYDMLEFKHSGEDWWETLKEKWKEKGIKRFLYEYARRCLLHRPEPKDYEAYDYRTALQAAVDYDSPEESYEYLFKLGLFPPPPEEEIELEALKEEAKTRYEELKRLFDYIERMGFVEEVRKRYARVDYRKLYEEERKKRKALERSYEERGRMVDQLKRRLAERRRERKKIIEELSKRIWSEWMMMPVKPKTDYINLIALIELFIRECERRFLNPSAIRIEEIVSPDLTPMENKKRILSELERYRTVSREEIERLERERDEWRRRAEEAEKRYFEAKEREAEVAPPPKPILGDREYELLLREFISLIEDEIILTASLRESLRRIFRLEWEVNRMAYMNFDEARELTRSLAEKWVKTLWEALRMYVGLMPRVEAEAEKKIAVDYEKLVDEVTRRIHRVVMEPGYIPPPPPPIPEEPVSPLSFPRRLTSEEIGLFWRHFERELWEHGLDANHEYNLRHFINFRDAWHESWDEVLRRFKLIVEDAIEGRPPRIFPPPEVVFKEIPRDPILWTALRDTAMPLGEQCESFTELAERVNEETGIEPKVTAEDVKKIFEEEYAKGDKADPSFKILRMEKPYYLWNIGFRPKEIEEKARRLTITAIGMFPKDLGELVKLVEQVHKFKVSTAQAKRWIEEELAKPPEQADAIIRTYREYAEKLVRGIL